MDQSLHVKVCIQKKELASWKQDSCEAGNLQREQKNGFSFHCVRDGSYAEENQQTQMKSCVTG